MADLVFNYKQVSDIEEAFSRVQEYVTPENMQKFKVNAQIEYDRDQHLMVASGKGFTLNVVFFSDRIELSLDTSFFLKPLRKTILKTLEDEFTKLV